MSNGTAYNSQPQVISINISEGGIPKLPMPSVQVGIDHIEGDGRAHVKHAKPHRAITLMDEEILTDLRAEGYAAVPGALGENLTVRGLRVQQLAPGMRLRFAGGVEIELTEERKPCFVLDSLDPTLKDAVLGRCGFLARIITGGTLEADAAITVLPGTRWPHTGAILAGGSSRRMGVLKEGVRLPDGRPMIAHVIEALQTVCQRVVVVGACQGFAVPEAVEHLLDLHPGDGPLAGIEALLASGGDDRYLVAACDQPLLTPALLHRLIAAQTESQGVCYSTDKRPIFPLPGIVLAEWLPAVRETLQQGARSVCRFLEQMSVTRIPITPAEVERLRSINSPDDLAALAVSLQSS
jgi:molybdopterin-guanine dinucleotide biosynthesis protein A